MYRLIVEVLTAFLILLFALLSSLEFDSLAGGGGGTSDMTLKIRFITESEARFWSALVSLVMSQSTSWARRSRPLQVDPSVVVQCLKGIEVKKAPFDRTTAAVSVKTT